MGKKALQKRKNWQTQSGKEALLAEESLFVIFETEFKNTDFELIRHPKHLKNLYSSVCLDSETLAQIYNPPNFDYAKTHWGVSPDFAIRNQKTGKILFGEIKRQDGWVENKEPSAGRGNAHERLCKLFTPGLIKAYRKISGIHSVEILPFWVIFQGDITRDPKRVREIVFWFDTYQNNFFMWRNGQTPNVLIAHFNQYLKAFLE